MCVQSVSLTHIHPAPKSSALLVHEADWSCVLPELHFSTKSLSTVWPYKAANSENWEKYALLLKLPLSVFFSHLQFLSLLLLSLFPPISHSTPLVFVLFSLHFKLSVFLQDMISLFLYWSLAFVLPTGHFVTVPSHALFAFSPYTFLHLEILGMKLMRPEPGITQDFFFLFKILMATHHLKF